MAFTQGLCDRIVQALVNVSGEGASQLVREKTGFLDSLVSPENTAGVEQIQTDQGNGKNFGVRINGIQRGIESDVVTAKPDFCASTNESAPVETLVNADQFVGKTQRFQASELRKICESKDEYIAEIMRAEFNAINKKLNRELITLQNAAFGRYKDQLVGAPASKNFQLLKNDGSPDYFGEAQFMQEYNRISAVGRPMVVGEGKLDLYVKQQGIGCCNDAGIDLAQAGSFAYFNDRFVGDVTANADSFIIYQPKAVQLVQFNENKGEFGFQASESFAHSTIVDPLTGIEYDWDWSYDECNKEWKMMISTNYSLFNIPSNNFATGDELEGVNFALEAVATQAV